MPNWCDNRLRVSGPNSVVRDFIEGATANDGKITLLHSYLPFPPGLEGHEIADKNGEPIGRAFSDRGYMWCLTNWGVKWGDSGTMVTNAHIIEDGDSNIEIYFTTPWGPPADGIQRISAIFPELVFTLACHEDGMGIAGGCQFTGGELLNDIDSPCPSWPDDDDEDKWMEEIDQMYAAIFARLAE